jgi:hypothetical protein
MPRAAPHATGGVPSGEEGERSEHGRPVRSRAAPGPGRGNSDGFCLLKGSLEVTVWEAGKVGTETLDKWDGVV